MATSSTSHVFLRQNAEQSTPSSKGSTNGGAGIVIPQFRGVRVWSSKKKEEPFSWNSDALDELRITFRDFDSPATFPTTANSGMDAKLGLHISWRKGTNVLEHGDFSPSNRPLLNQDIEAAKAACEMVRDLLNLPDCPDGSNPDYSRNRNIFNSFSKIGASAYYIYQDISLGVTAKMMAESLRKRGFAIPEISSPLHLDLQLTRNAGSILQAGWTMDKENVDIRLEVQKGESVAVMEGSKEEDSLHGVRGRILQWDNANGPSFAPLAEEKDDSPEYFSLSESRHSTRIQPARTFHPKLFTTIELPKTFQPTDQFSACSLHVLYTLPPSIFVDPYQLADLTPLSLAGTENGRILGVWGETDLEKPVDQVRGWGSLVLVHVGNVSTIANSKSSEQVTITLPVHSRYQPPRSDGKFEISVELQPPDVFWMCQDSREVPDTFLLPCPFSFLYPPIPSNHHRVFFPIKADPLEATQNVFIPVGRIQDINVVGAITPIAAVFACVVIGIGMWLQGKKKSIGGKKKQK